jgi:hypothetical protein
MATPPISSTRLPVRSRARRAARRLLHARTAWLVADTIAIGASAALFIHVLA